MVNRSYPTVRLRRLAAHLRRLRAATGFSRETVFEKTGIQTTTLYRIESAKVRPQRRTLIGLLNIYEVQEPMHSELLAMLADSGKKGWNRSYQTELSAMYTDYISFEQEARSSRSYEGLVIPGLLQTAEYARAITRASLPMADEGRVRELVQIRLERQALLHKENPLELWAVIDEAAIRRQAGGERVMTDQLVHIRKMMDEPHITVQVLSFAAGAHAGTGGSFVIMDYPDIKESELVYIDNAAGDQFLEDEAEIRRYGMLFDNLRATALSPDQSADMIGKAAGLIE